MTWFGDSDGGKRRLIRQLAEARERRNGKPMTQQPAPDVNSARDVFDDLLAMMGVADRPGPIRHVWKEMRPRIAAALAASPTPAPAPSGVDRGALREAIYSTVACDVRLKWHGNDYATLDPRSIAATTDAILELIAPQAEEVK